jgi:hypothetical protein
VRVAALVTTLAMALAATPAGGEPSKPAARAAEKKPLAGRTIDFPYDGKDVGKPRLAWTGRAFVHDRARERADRGEALPLVVFLHGLNKELIPHRWIGGGQEGDVRRIVSDLIEAGTIPPVVVAGPGSVVKEAVSRGASFAELDLDTFLDRTDAALGPGVRIDPRRVVVTGHSGAGCSEAGGLIAARRSRRPILAIAAIDTCMGATLARELASAPPTTHVVVTWQAASWNKRPFELFSATFRNTTRAHPPGGALRELDRLPAEPRPHDATVGQTFSKWLPRLLVPPAGDPAP